jgi:hypothetical protein
MWLILFVAMNLCSILTGLVAGKQIQFFLKKHKTIASEQVLEEFKTLVRRQMYMVYFILFFLIIGLFLNVIVIINYGLLGFVLTLPINVYSFWQSQYCRRLEAKARSLSAANEFLERRYYLVSNTWLNKPLPDF